MAKKLKFFDTEADVLAYLTSELLATLRDDLNNSDRSERKDLKDKIHDIESIEDRLTVTPREK